MLSGFQKTKREWTGLYNPSQNKSQLLFADQ